MTNTLSKSALTLPTVHQDQGTSKTTSLVDQQLIVRNVDLPLSNDLENFLKVIFSEIENEKIT